MKRKQVDLGDGKTATIIFGKWQTPKYGYELTPKIRKEFDWMADEEFETSSFYYHRRNWYTTADFMRIDSWDNPSNFMKNLGFDGYLSDSYFSGVMIRYDPQDYERVQLATYIC